MKRKVNPNRMMLLRLRRRLELARRGHKLLKNKQEKLMQNFFSLIDETTKLRRRAEEEFLKISLDYTMARSFTGPQALGDALELSDCKGQLDIKTRYEMGIRIPEYEMSFNREAPVYKHALSSPMLDSVFERFYDSFPSLLKLASRENALFKMSEELEKTRRRVNALEYVLIPDLETTIKGIERKLSEDERSTQTRLMKIKDMVQ
ncbi:MAG TPA: V-type ATP synthase subunit D [Candidatus Krumholzibacteriaceae bacterium]|nr:V-type ATP synthase subunit D [Candidatus Krumholzibacteriaceae bacterium]